MNPATEHGDDGTRYVEASNYTGHVHACLCGDKFVDLSELRQHINEFPASQQSRGINGERGSGTGLQAVRQSDPNPLSSTAYESFGEDCQRSSTWDRHDQHQ